jgi:hypothetical protein
MDSRDSIIEGTHSQVYRDEEDAPPPLRDSASDTVLIAPSEASDEEHFPSQQSDFASKYIPPRLQNTWRATALWAKGPQPPRPWKIHPFFPHIQTAPLQFLDNYFPKRRHRITLLVFFYFCWLLSFSMVLYRSAFAADIPGYGSPVRIRCTDRFWWVRSTQKRVLMLTTSGMLGIHVG